jgi:TolB-like protein/tetratricopeptide (TPR) repeat protein
VHEAEATDMSAPTGWQALFAELRRRKVFRVATIYVITLWPLIQLADILQPAFGFPDRVITVLLYAFVGGFPVALALAWLFDLTREGVVLTDAAGNAAAGAPPLIGRTAEGVVIGVLTLLVVALFLVKMSTDQQAAGTAPAAPAPSPSPAVDVATSIAVLPFTTFSAEEQDQVFADGLTEELLNQLARVPRLRVAARTSSFAYKGVNRKVQEIGRELGVGRILEGSVRRSDVGATIRITAQLVDVESGAHLWSQTYDREFRDVLRIQDEIAGAVADHLSVTLLGPSGGARQGAATPEALIAVSRGRAAIAKRSAASIVAGVAQLEEGVRASPEWAEANASLAEAYVLAVLYAGADRADMLGRARAAADRALELDPQLGAAWASLGLVRMQDHAETAAAKEALERAIELSPSYAMAYMWLGTLQDDPERVLELHRKALELDPRSAVAAYNVANDLLGLGREDEAMQVFDRIVAADPLYAGAYRITAQLNERHGRLDEALLDHRSIWDAEQDADTANRIAELSLSIGDLDAARRWADRGATTTDPFQRLSTMWLRALIEWLGGNTPEAQRWLERIARAAAEQGEIGHLFSGFAWSLAGRHAEAAAAYDSAPAPDAIEGGRLGKGSFVDAYIMAVTSFRAAGRPSDADRVLVSIRTQVDRRIAESPRVDPAVLYHRARIHLLDGDRRMALALLARAADEGWSEAWRLRIDPVLKELHGEPRFVALEKSMQARIAGMRESLERERTLR